MVSKRKATVEIAISPVKKAASNRKRKVVDIVEVPEEEEEIKVKGKGSKTRNTRTNAAVEIGDIGGLIRSDTFGDIDTYVKEKESTTRSPAAKKESSKSSKSKSSKKQVSATVSDEVVQETPRASPSKTENKNVKRSPSKSSPRKSSKDKAVDTSDSNSENEANITIFGDLVSTWSALLDPIYYSVFGFIVLIILFAVDAYFKTGSCQLFPEYSLINHYVESLGFILTLLIILTIGLFFAVVGPFKLVTRIISKQLQINKINANIMVLFTILVVTARYYQVLVPEK